jgi:hypothetical protein
MVGRQKTERLRAKRYLSSATDAEAAAEQVHSALARTTLLKAAELSRFLAELSEKSPGERLVKNRGSGIRNHK